jgi:predicted nucleic acid-binding protein
VIFVDTSAWFAASVPSDPNYRQADAFLATVDPTSLVTTDYVLDESMTLFRIRGESKRAYELGHRILEERICRLVWVEKQDVLKSWVLFESYRDKDWSFTNCVSRTVIERLKVTAAFAFDEHFRQFGIPKIFP